MPGGRQNGGRRGGGARGGSKPSPQGEIYLEFQKIDKQQRVIAIDPVSGTEVTVFGPASVSRDELTRIAVRKLQRRLENKADEGADQGGASKAGSNGIRYA